jgi:membrane fusion protein, heavy metal efflux system
MNSNSRVTLQWPAVAAAVIALLAVGAGTTYLLMLRFAGSRPPSQGSAASPQAMSTAPSPGGTGNSSSSSSSQPLPDVIVTLSPEATKRAGIELVPVTRAAARSSAVRIPGTVEANAYKQVVVTPLVSGRVTRVLVELGDRVRRGQTLLQVFSPELADAQTKYLSAKAELEAHEQELARTTKLVAIGAASQQEMERLHAEHSAKLAGVQSLRSRLVLLGLPASAIDALSPGKEIEATTDVPAPIEGIITERAANVGLNVDTATKVFTVVDLSSVWVVGALYERDFSRVRVGSEASVTTKADPSLARPGRVSYIDPQVTADTRTARVRVEVPNPRQELRLGMYADVDVALANRQALMIPRVAVQSVNDRQVVYVANPAAPGKFIEREVHLGDASGEDVEVVSGVQHGDQVVSKGSFFVRAERERLGLRPAAGTQSTPPTPGSGASGSAVGVVVQTARITVGEQGYEPSRVNLKSGVPARLTFLRTTDKTCGTAVVFPSLNIRRELPLNQPVDIEFTPEKTGDIGFVCGMNMLHGNVVVE